jgi:PAS domain S-box-containing protein
MYKNYLKNSFFDFVRNDEKLFQEVVISDKNKFFVWDFENQDNLWMSDSLCTTLGLDNEVFENNLNLWKSHLFFSSNLKKELSNLNNSINFKTAVTFINSENQKIDINSTLFFQKNQKGIIQNIIGLIDTIDFLHLNKNEIKYNNLLNSLKITEDRFSFISDNISDGIFIVEDSKMVFASSAYLKMARISFQEKEKLQNEDPLHNVHPEDKERLFALLTHTITNKLPSIKYIFRCQIANGDYIWREDIMNLQHGEGIKYKAIIITRDITADKIIELEKTERQKSIDLQNRLLIKLYSNTTELEIGNKINLITKIALEGLNIDRSNYWEIEEDFLVCKNHTDITQDSPSLNLKLNVRDLPKYFEAMNNQTAIVADDVLTNEFTSELIDSYLKPLGITDMLDIPVRENGNIHGVLCFEHRDDPRVWSDNDISFARSLADFLSLSLEAERRKNAEQQLIQNQEKLKFISENTSDGVLIIEKNKITYASPAYTKLSGYPVDFLKGLDLADVFSYIHPDDLSAMKKNIYTNIDKKTERFSYEYRIRGINNKYYWREDSATVLYKKGEPYSQFILISRDITQRKKTEQELIQNEQQLRLISENSTDGFVIIENKIITYISPSYAKFLGYEMEEILNSDTDYILNSIHKDDRDRIAKFVYQNLENQVISFKSEFRLKGKDGVYHWREDSTNVVYDKNGKYSKYIIISRDINERKETEQKLVESEQQLRLITENTSDGVFVVENSKITFVSPAYLKLLNYTIHDVLKLSIDDIFNHFHPEDLITLKPYIYDCLRTKKTAFKYEVRFKDSSGNFHWREDSANVIYDENGQYSKYIVVTRDISVRKETENERNRLHKITEKQNQKLVNFTHIVSHDIRSHTSNLSMILELFEETKDDEDQEKYFLMMKESTNKLSDTIYYLNETVAVQSGKNHDYKLLNLKSEVDKALLGVKAFVKTNEARLKISIDNDIKVNVTQSYLESIMFNLLTNAIKYKSNKRKPEINITAKKINNEVELTIQDNGIGIDLNRNKNKIFGMYKTFHGNEDAVGLGLFMVKNHIESMGGRIEIESELDRGTTFKLYFI